MPPILCHRWTTTTNCGPGPSAPETNRRTDLQKNEGKTKQQTTPWYRSFAHHHYFEHFFEQLSIVTRDCTGSSGTTVVLLTVTGALCCCCAFGSVLSVSAHSNQDTTFNSNRGEVLDKQTNDWADMEGHLFLQKYAASTTQYYDYCAIALLSR